MKIGAHIYLWMERWSDAEVGLLERARGLGLEAIELSVGLDVKFSAALTRRVAEANGITLLVGPGGAWPDGADLSDDDPANRRRALEFHKAIVDQTAELGAVAYAGALYGRPGKVLRRRPPADELPRTAEGLHELGEYARRAGVKIVLEPMSRFRSHVANTPAQMLAIVNRADHANLHILLDTYHLVTEVRDYAAAIRSVGDRLWGLHACENDRGVPGGGLIPWPAVFAALKETKCQYVGFEGYNTGIDDFGWRRGIFQNVCPDGDAFVRQAVAFTRPFVK
ncbi:MAG TPA: sugar phosphate isomerase/epimerase family protein [Opitutaceae bacterium]|nr:sugar phosphate isomerase/epimerase family protein [Opitutaceae bacterium]HND62331.1 sugar phosphate isomerase/epimerase family protein [Opitutaceae bacterium]